MAMNTSSSLLSSSSRARCEQQSAQAGSLHTPTTDHRPHSAADHRFAIARASSRAARRCLHSGLRHTLQLVHRHFEHPNCIPRAPGCALARALACALGCALPRALAAGRAAGAAAAAAAGSCWDPLNNGGGAGRAGAPAPSPGWGSALEVDESKPISSSPLTGGGRARASAPGTWGITSRGRSPHTVRSTTRRFLAGPTSMRTGGAGA